MTNQAIQWVHGRKYADAEQTFLHLFRPGCSPCAHQVPKEWIEKYEGNFDQG